ncbi:MAG: 8-amino-7-oxononanoate synthase [Fibrobacter sp.]|uniref:aminotransferase class I/II-fold pyridoxal phosphate-dependent enzyme n=1 Tax=Fibrobacter sp. TaxID=35828 RepID=UPI0025C19253|nr:8-amino-7-oxononanoate synthase [Fibrobacter sp.]MBQ7081723.1 8-amino-7-oxononanoate synthase [Fibrobacter sp.]
MNERIIEFFTKDALEAARANNTYRTLRHISSPEASHVTIAGKDTVLLASNSYLDLANVPELKQAMADAVLEWGTGSGGARLTTGNKTPHDELEEFIAKFKGEEAAIAFNTGYMANVGAISALCGKNDFIFSDELNHASIIDGIRLSRAKCFVYKHNDMADLERAIEAAKAEFLAQSTSASAALSDAGNAKQGAHPFRGLIVTDAVFSMDGDLANLPELLRIAKAHDVLLMIDEAHATGVLGRTGRGLAEHYNCEHADVTVGTLSKAVAAEGGFVAGSKQLIEFLKNKSRSFIFTTAMAPAVAAAALRNLQFIDAHPERVQQLRDNVKFFCDDLRLHGLQVPQTESAIIPIIIGDEAKALQISETLQNEGVLIPAIRYPTVAKGQARLRASLMATHTKEELEFAAAKIAEAI